MLRIHTHEIGCTYSEVALQSLEGERDGGLELVISSSFLTALSNSSLEVKVQFLITGAIINLLGSLYLYQHLVNISTQCKN